MSAHHISNLGQVTSLIAQFAQQCADEWNHADDFGGGHDCGTFIADSQARRARYVRRRVVHLARANKREVLRQLEARCCGRYLHFSGLGAAADLVLGNGVVLV